MFTARVPGLGLVEWSPDRVEAYAHELARTHRPERLSIRWRGRWIFRLPLPVEHACKHCTEPWPCPSAWWAQRYQTSQARTITHQQRPSPTGSLSAHSPPCGSSASTSSGAATAGDDRAPASGDSRQSAWAE